MELKKKLGIEVDNDNNFDKVKSVQDKDKKETNNLPIENLVKQIYDITKRIEYYENKYAQTQDEFSKRWEKTLYMNLH